MGMEIIIFLSVGIFAGTLAGMFGIGGGVIIVPALIATFIYLGFDQVITTHLAIGTSLASIFFTGIASAYSHNQKKGVVWKIFYPLSSGIAVGAILGAFIAGNISGDSLRYLVGIFLIIVAIQLISSFEIKASKRESHSISSVLSGSGIGMASSIIGISATSIFSAKIGVAITHSLSDLVLKILFSLFLIIGALYMLAI